MIYSEDDLIPLSYLSQFYYCKRRAGLLLLEEQWQDNVHTVEGSILHEIVHSGVNESRSEIKILRSVHLKSLALGITGIADCIECYASDNGYALPWIDGKWNICPIEYKHGEKRNEIEYEIQVCAQAMCIEEMTGSKIEYGYIYYGDDRRRLRVDFGDGLRAKVKEGASELHAMMISRLTPKVRKSSKCRECSMNNICLPGELKRTERYLAELMAKACGDD